MMKMRRIFCSFEFAHTSGQVFLLVTIHLGRRTSDASLMMMMITAMMMTSMMMMIKDKYDLLLKKIKFVDQI